MTTTDTDALTERIARDLWDHDNLHMSAAWRDMAWDDMGGSEPTDERIAYMLRAAAVLPTVRAAQHAAWVQGAALLDETGYYSLAQLESFSPYREETPDEQ